MNAGSGSGAASAATAATGADGGGSTSVQPATTSITLRPSAGRVRSAGRIIGLIIGGSVVPPYGILGNGGGV